MPVTRRDFIKIMTTGATLLSVPPLLAQEPLVPTPRASVKCPILMYHYISSAPEDADYVLRDLTVPPEQFAEQLDYLRDNGFTTITMTQLWAGMEGAPLPEKPIVLTFDDGYWDAHAHATPLLLERGMVGTFYICSGFMGQPSYMRWEDAAQIQGAGMEIGGHSATHANLSVLGRAELEVEIKESTALIEQTLGLRPVSFCYPFGYHNTFVTTILREAGYQTAVTTSDALTHYRNNPYRMGRVRIRNRHTIESFAWLVNR